MRRKDLAATLRKLLTTSPVVALLGPRQCGKTTLARELAVGRRSARFDLEDLTDLRQLDHPDQALRGLRGLVILDEIQRKPELLPLLRVLADRPGRPARFLLLGSASLSLVKGVSETLAGRVRFLEMSGFHLGEIGPQGAERLWLRGGFPPSYLARSARDSFGWRRDFIKTFLERDIPQLGFTIPAAALGRFWTMLAHMHGQTWHGAEIARSLAISEPTVRRYLDLLTGAYVVRQVQPWSVNVGKRVVKSPKVYIRDSGILHALLSLADAETVRRHPKFGASWEGFALEQVLSLLKPYEAYCWSTYDGAELDLLALDGRHRLGFEFKAGDAPGLTRSMHAAFEALALDRLWIVYPGERRYDLTDTIEAVPLSHLPARLRRSS